MKKNIYEAENGKLSGLKPIQGGAGHKLNPEAAAAYDKMVAAAKEDGVTWSITDSYRAYEIQNKIFDWSYYKKTGKKRKVGTAGTPVAYPGTSNHGWGAAVDLGAKYGDKAHTWLTKNASKFGFSNPFSNPRTEPWHWEHVESAKKMKSGAKLVEPEIDDTKDNEETKTDTGTDTKTDTNTEKTDDKKEEGGRLSFLSSMLKLAGFKEEYEPKTQSLNEEIKRMKQLMK